MNLRRYRKIIILLANGFDEVQMVSITTILRQAGFPVIVVGMTAKAVLGEHGIALEPDCSLDDALEDIAQILILPGGMRGVRTLNADPRVHKLLCEVINHGGYIAAMREAYIVLRDSGALEITRKMDDVLPVYDLDNGENLADRVWLEGPLVFGKSADSASEVAMTLVSLVS